MRSKLDPTDEASLRGFTRTAVLTNRAQDALSWVKSLTLEKTSVHAQIAISKLLAAASLKPDADRDRDAGVRDSPRRAGRLRAARFALCGCRRQHAARAGAADACSLAPDTAPTHYYTAVSAFLRGDAGAALDSAQKAIAADSTYAAAYDLAGAAHTKLGQADLAAQAFQTSLRFDPHDSTAYTNLGLLALAAGTHGRCEKLLRGSAVAHAQFTGRAGRALTSDGVEA